MTAKKRIAAVVTAILLLMLNMGDLCVHPGGAEAGEEL